MSDQTLAWTTSMKPLMENDVRIAVTACAKAGNIQPPGWTKPETAVQDVFSPSTADLGEGASRFPICHPFLLSVVLARADLLRMCPRFKILAGCIPLVLPYTSIHSTKMRFGHIVGRRFRKTVMSRLRCIPNLPKLLPRISSRGTTESPRRIKRKLVQYLEEIG